MRCDSPGLGQEPTLDRRSALYTPVWGVTQYCFCHWSQTRQTQHLNESQTCIVRESACGMGTTLRACGGNVELPFLCTSIAFVLRILLELPLPWKLQPWLPCPCQPSLSICPLSSSTAGPKGEFLFPSTLQLHGASGNSVFCSRLSSHTGSDSVFCKAGLRLRGLHITSP